MRFFFLFLILTTSAVWANHAKKTPPEHSDAFHNSGFSVDQNSITPQQQEEAPPEWVTPQETEIPQAQEDDLSNRVNEWSEQSERASQGVQE